MNEKDLEQIEKLLSRKLDEQSAAFNEKLSRQTAAFDEKLSSKLDELTAAFDQKLATKLEQQSFSFDRKLDAVAEMLSTDFSKQLQETEGSLETAIMVLDTKVDLVIENHQALVERMDRMEHVQKENHTNLERRLSNLVADLATHKADPQAHTRGYSIKEDGERFVCAEPEGVKAGSVE